MAMSDVELAYPTGRLSRKQAIDYFRRHHLPILLHEHWQRFVALLIEQKLVDCEDAREWKPPL